jgi:hypothetical protein
MEMINRRFSVVSAIVLVMFAQVNCQMTQTPYSTTAPTAIFAEVPKLLVRGEEHKFSIQTTPEVECHAGIGYYNINDKWVTMDLPTVESDENGICQWTWDIPDDAKDGVGELRGYIQGEDQSNDIFPATFCIGRCPQ